MVLWKDINTISRILEFVFTVLVVACHRPDPCELKPFEKAQFVDGITIAFVIISVYAIVALLLNESTGFRSWALLALFGLILYVAIGAILINEVVENRDGKCNGAGIIAAVIFSFCAAICYLVDMAFLVRKM